MPIHAAFLRAVNLGATRKAPKERLLAAFEAAGLEDAATFRTSGNVVFSGSGSAAALREAIEDALESELGFEVPTFVRTRKQLEAISAMRPFSPKAVERSKGKLQVALLERKPKAAERSAIEELSAEEDLLAVEGTELYWLPSGGTQDSPLDMKAVDRTLGLNTMRTQGTIAQLTDKYF